MWERGRARRSRRRRRLSRGEEGGGRGSSGGRRGSHRGPRGGAAAAAAALRDLGRGLQGAGPVPWGGGGGVRQRDGSCTDLLRRGRSQSIKAGPDGPGLTWGPWRGRGGAAGSGSEGAGAGGGWGPGSEAPPVGGGTSGLHQREGSCTYSLLRRGGGARRPRRGLTWRLEGKGSGEAPEGGILQALGSLVVPAKCHLVSSILAGQAGSRERGFSSSLQRGVTSFPWAAWKTKVIHGEAGLAGPA